MKKLFLGVTMVAVGVVFFFANSASAKTMADLSRISFSFVPESRINSACGLPAGYASVWSCYMQDIYAGDIVPRSKIIFRTDTPSALLPYVFLRELGRFFTYDYAEEDLEQFFKPTYAEKSVKNSARNIKDIAADSFVMWALGGTVPLVESDFFTRKVLGKEPVR
ncbi:MAG: hypothetical protein FJY98_03580 [Candidatus Liptonbacteria bacterium]|nr:hypothetical protein [Candidatus Liptonbacteria bacterium]